MIHSFRHKGLRLFYETGKTSGISASHARRVLIRLDRLNRVHRLEELPPEWECHPLRGDLDGFYSIKISGAWRLIFRFEDGLFYDLDYVQYH